MENKIKKGKEVVSPKGLKPKKAWNTKPQSPWRKKKEKKRNLDQKMEEEPA